jgi:3-phosphoshikimate 1-carboxyvinyltransferase
MQLVCEQSRLHGVVDIPGSKSHTIRAVAIASLAAGRSRIEAPLISADAEAAVRAYRALGATIETHDDHWFVDGFDGKPHAPAQIIDVMNSGTTLRLAVGSAALLQQGQATFTGDDQIQRRPIGPLAQSLRDMGATVQSTRGNDCAPVIVSGPLRGGKTSIEAMTSQYVSSLLINCPLAASDCDIDVPLLHEKPYVHLTLWWLERAGIELTRDELRRFHVPGGQRYKPFDLRVPGDFSSATFFLCAGALSDNDVRLRGLDMDDPQGDKAVIDYLRQMGARIDIDDDTIRVRPPADGALRGCELDLNATPDALPMMAVTACFAEGRTVLGNVPQARLKETDRIAVMAAELSKMGATIAERPDGLVIERSDLKPAEVLGHHDHRVVMSLAVAGSMIESGTRISTAEAMNVTFPTFVDCMNGLGAGLATA